MENTILMYLISSLFLLCVNENTETISKDQFHNVKNPLHDLYWLTDLEFYDCEGNVICEFGGFDGRNFCFDFECNVSNMELIYNDSNTVVHNDTTYCITNPLQELKWLREKFEIMKANPFKSYIYKCIYNYQEGFIIDICFMCPDVLVEFYDCEGNVICEFGGFDGRNTCPDFESSVSNMELIWTNDSNGQLKADAGEDKIICSDEFAVEIEIGGSPTASGGVEPYKYTWSGKLLLASSPENAWIYASNILDDTTNSNPVLKNLNLIEEPIMFYLKVEDATGKIVNDSVRIDNSTFFVQSIYILPDTIIRGDSIKLIGDPYFINNFLPLAYYLSPSHGLIDSTNIYGWAKPDTSVTYFLQAVNSAGCVSEKIQYWHIEVIDTTINSIKNSELRIQNLQFFPNPVKNQITISNPSNIKIKKIELINFSGRIVQLWNATECAGNTLNIQHISPGVYLLKAETDAGVKTEKLVVQ